MVPVELRVIYYMMLIKPDPVAWKDKFYAFPPGWKTDHEARKVFCKAMFENGKWTQKELVDHLLGRGSW